MEHAIIEQRAYLDTLTPPLGRGHIDLLVDEWGTWDLSELPVERQNGMFWQQNTVKDAVAAALGLNIFHRHADKLGMCNIAQIVNVLQASLLTSGASCVRTPTWYALTMMKDHRNRTALRVGSSLAPARELSVSASRDERSIVVTLANPDPQTARSIRLAFDGETPAAVRGQIIAHHDLNACNAFDRPDNVIPQAIHAELSGDGINVTMPPLSVVHLHIAVS